MRRALLVGVFIVLPVILYAQAARPTDNFQWTQDDEPLSRVQTFQFQLELDGVVQPTPLIASCTGTAKPFTCKAPIPPITPSQHAARIRAVEVIDGAPMEGPWSNVLNFSMRATPNKPENLVIVRP